LKLYMYGNQLFETLKMCALLRSIMFLSQPVSTTVFFKYFMDKTSDSRGHNSAHCTDIT